MKTYSIKNLTEDQYRLILESLLFSTSTSVNAKWYNEDTDVLMECLLKMRKSNPEILLKNVSIFKEKSYEDSYAKKIVDFFPEVLENITEL
ncbi:hypothetical protein EBU91_01970 [bacterium]|nr:hypothetical protein [bacterium]